MDSDEDDGDHEKKAIQNANKKSTGMEEDSFKKEADDDDSELDELSDDEDDEFDKNILENFNSCIDDNEEVDEFIIFRNTLQSII